VKPSAALNSHAAEILYRPRSRERIDDTLGFGDNVLHFTFLEVGRTIGQRAGRARRIDRCAPALSDTADLDAMALVFDHGPASHVAIFVRWGKAPRSAPRRAISASASAINRFDWAMARRVPTISSAVSKRMRHASRCRSANLDLVTATRRDKVCSMAALPFAVQAGAYTGLSATGAWQSRCR